MAKKRATRKNVEAGFWNATGFHPIRASRDYDADRAGDEYGDYGPGYGQGKKSARKPKKKNPVRKSRKKSIVLNNPGRVKIQQLPNGQIGVTVVRKKGRKR